MVEFAIKGLCAGHHRDRTSRADAARAARRDAGRSSGIHIPPLLGNDAATAVLRPRVQQRLRHLVPPQPARQTGRRASGGDRSGGLLETEDLRQELIEVIDERLDETEVVLFTQADQQFHFVRSVIVVFDTHRTLAHPRELRGRAARYVGGQHLLPLRRRAAPGTVGQGRLPRPGSWALGPSTCPLVDIDRDHRSLLRVALRDTRPAVTRCSRSTSGCRPVLRSRARQLEEHAA